jgi:gliding motility-associated-like protein
MLGCDKDSVQFTASNGAGNTPATYQWFFGDGSSTNVQNPLHTYTIQGNYTVRLYTELNGCTDSSSITINTLHPMNADFNMVNIACAGQPVSVINNSTATGPFTNEFNWGDGTIESSGTHTYTQAGTYTVKLVITDQLGCKDSMSRTITVKEAPFASFTMSDSVVCVGDPIFFLDSVNNQTSSFEWNFGDNSFATNVHNPTHSYDKDNTYTVKITAKNSSCPDSYFTKDITVNPIPTVYLGKDTSICPGLTGSILLQNTLSSSGTYRWNTGSTSSSILVNELGHYWLEISDKGCTSTDSIWIARDCYLNIPNSFSPNGDGLNDYFLPRELLSSGLMTFSMSIYNRWGENIFTTTKIDGRGWDGKYNGIAQPLGVYVYKIDVIFSNNIRKSYSGNVTLVR